MASYSDGNLGRMRLLASALVVAGLLGYASSAAAQAVRGVTDTEIVIGTVTDLSSLGATQGVNNSDAIRMAFDDANAKGGVHGRKIKYIVEDNQLSVSRAVQAMNKLLNSDHVFLALADGSTSMNEANMPAQFAKNVANVFPLTAARSMYEPYHRLKFALFASYYDHTLSTREPEKPKRQTPALAPLYPIRIFGFSRGQGTDTLGGEVFCRAAWAEGVLRDVSGQRRR